MSLLATDQAPFALVAGVGPAQLGHPGASQAVTQAVANWQALRLEQVLVGEWDLPSDGGRRVKAEVATTDDDAPALGELLRVAAEQTRLGWLLLVDVDALLTRDCLRNLSQLVAGGASQRVLFGRCWRLEPALLRGISTPDDLMAAIDRDGVLDPPGRAGWLLLPRGGLLAAPPGLDCSVPRAAAWFTSIARQLGWPVVDATAVAPLAAPYRSAQAGEASVSVESVSVQSQAVLPHGAGLPRLSLLLAAPERQLPSLCQQLLPAPMLPWEVIARPADPADGSDAMAAAWNSGLNAATGALVWPLTSAIPPLALLPVVLRVFEAGGIDCLELGDTHQLARLVWQTQWLRRLGGHGDNCAIDIAVKSLLRRARERGAHCAKLPFSHGSTADQQPLLA